MFPVFCPGGCCMGVVFFCFCPRIKKMFQAKNNPDSVAPLNSQPIYGEDYPYWFGPVVISPFTTPKFYGGITGVHGLPVQAPHVP